MQQKIYVTFCEKNNLEVNGYQSIIFKKASLNRRFTWFANVNKKWFTLKISRLASTIEIEI